ncbi:MAG: AbrB/MazE/SpoVT family DNA-binding domain-containing protein [Candidatus Diapherotrites archaeon]
MSEVEIITVSKKGQVVLPKNIREQLHIHQGSKLLLIQKEDKITLSKVDSLIDKEPNEKKFTLLASEKSLAKDWLSKEEEKAWKDL